MLPSALYGVDLGWNDLLFTRRLVMSDAKRMICPGLPCLWRTSCTLDTVDWLRW